VRGAFDLDDGLVGSDGVVAMLKVEAEGDVGAVLEEDIADGTVDDVVDGRGLTIVRVVSVADMVSIDKYRPGGRYSPPQDS
jgi:hypothetical protein